MFGAMDLGVADDRERAGHEQAAQIAITLFADAAAGPCPRSSAASAPAQSSREVAA